MGGRDLTNQTFSRLTALEKIGRQKNGNALWKCVCVCGNYTVVDSYSLTHQITRSCGCLRRDVSHESIQATRVHMGDATPLNKWQRSSASLKTSIRNQSGVVGVSYDTQASDWVAKMMVHGRYVLNKHFKNKEEAVLKRHKVERVYKKTS